MNDSSVMKPGHSLNYRAKCYERFQYMSFEQLESVAKRGSVPLLVEIKMA